MGGNIKRSGLGRNFMVIGYGEETFMVDTIISLYQEYLLVSDQVLPCGLAVSKYKEGFTSNKMCVCTSSSYGSQSVRKELVRTSAKVLVSDSKEMTSGFILSFGKGGKSNALTVWAAKAIIAAGRICILKQRW
jgi:hypothetical protein